MEMFSTQISKDRQPARGTRDTNLIWTLEADPPSAFAWQFLIPKEDNGLPP